AEGVTGINASEFSRIRTAQLGRFTVDRLMTILNRLNRRVDVQLPPGRLPPGRPHLPLAGGIPCG
ncbi:MAG: XRE family transcriptional regulator, partial [Gammaproteobacteria bacterium]